jgi:hypothetical protein
MAEFVTIMDNSEKQKTYSREEVSSASDPEDPRNMGKIKRISYQSRGLVDDIKSWVDLRMTLTQMDIEAKVDARLNRAIVGGVVGGLAFLTLTFGLVAASLGIGAWLGHDAWGFLAVAGFLLVVTVILLLLKPRVIDLRTIVRSRGDSNA